MIRGAILVAAGLALAACAMVTAVGCYDPNKPPPCRPDSVDWPRCRPWDPPMVPRDAGGDRE